MISICGRDKKIPEKKKKKNKQTPKQNDTNLLTHLTYLS